MVEHHSSIFEIMLPKEINFVIFILVIGWILRKQFMQYFNRLHEEIKNHYESTLDKIREAERLLTQQNQKLGRVESDIEQIQIDAKVGFEHFESRYAEGMKKRIEKAKSDALLRFEAEKVQDMTELNESVVDAMIEKSKAMVRKDKDLQKKVSEKMLEDITQ